MNHKTMTALDYDSIYAKRSLSEQGIDIHVYVVPLQLWRDQLHSADSQTVITEAISAGFIRVMPNAIVNSLRIDIENQLGFETVPRNFVFLKCVGRCFTVMKTKQEYSLKAKNFIPPQTVAPEIFLMELTGDIRSILSSSRSNQSQLQDSRGHEKYNSHVTTPHLKPNQSQSIVLPHLNDFRISFEEEEEAEDESEREEEEEEKRSPGQLKRQLTVTKSLVVETGDYVLTPNSKYTQTMTEEDAEEAANAKNRIRSKKEDEEEQRKEMLRRLALEQQREEQRKREEMEKTRKESDIVRREEEWRRKQEEELRKRLEEDQRRKQDEQRKWLEEEKQRLLEEKKKQEEEQRKRKEEEIRKKQEEEIRKKQEEESKKKQEEELKKKLESQKKGMTEEILQRKQEEELRKKQGEERKRMQEEELRKKQDEERRKKQEEELRKMQDEERRKKQEEEQRKRKDEGNTKKEEDRKRMTEEQKKAAEKDALLKEIKRMREDRKMQELRKDELTRKMKSFQERSQLNRNNIKDSWRKKYLEEKKKTPALESDCNRLNKELNAINKKILSNVEATSRVITHGPNQKPSEKSNLKIQAIRLRMEIEDLKGRLDNLNMRYTTEHKLRTQAEQELQLRRNQSRKKVHTHFPKLEKQKPNAASKKQGAAGGGGRTGGSQGSPTSRQRLPPVA